MKPIPLNAETEEVARRIVWFEGPAEALADPVGFMAYAMARATHEDMKVIRHYVSDDEFRESPGQGPPGYYRSSLAGLLEFQDGTLSHAKIT